VYMVTNFRSGQKCFGSHKFTRELPFIQSVLSGYHAMSRMHCLKVVLSEGNSPSEFELNRHFSV
jgi:hypothetical protein